jgi:hypothetical protein
MATSVPVNMGTNAAAKKLHAPTYFSILRNSR